MAKAPTEEQSQLKRRARRRLVGSIALVTVIAVVLPWVLESEPRDGEQQIAIQIPSPGAGKFAPKAPPGVAPSSETAATTPEPASTPSAPAPAAGSEDALGAEQAKILAPPVKPAAQKPAPAKERAVEKPAADSGKKTADKAHAAAERKAPTDNKPYVVQVAALADAEKAADIQKSLASKGLKSYTEKVKTAGGEVTRVRVGPFPNRDAAEKERGRMKSLGFDGNVAPK